MRFWFMALSSSGPALAPRSIAMLLLLLLALVGGIVWHYLDSWIWLPLL